MANPQLPIFVNDREVTSIETPKKKVNAFIGFRSYYCHMAELRQLEQKERSRALRAMWQSDKFHAEWELMCELYSAIRDDLIDDGIDMQIFFQLATPHLAIVDRSVYIQTFNWELVENADGSRTYEQSSVASVQNTRVAIDGLSLFRACMRNGLAVRRPQELFNKVSSSLAARMSVQGPARLPTSGKVYVEDYASMAREDPWKAMSFVLGSDMNNTGVTIYHCEHTHEIDRVLMRYLTPAKIGLLTIINLYIEEVVSNEAVLPVLTFAISQIIAGESTGGIVSSPSRENPARISILIKQFEEALISLPAADGLPGRSLWDRFLDKLWDLNSLHALCDFFESLPQLLARTKEELRQLAEQGNQEAAGLFLSRNSPLGLFVRRCHLEFSRLPFHHVAELWEAFVNYRQPTVAYLKRRNRFHGIHTYDEVLTEAQDEWRENAEVLAQLVYGEAAQETRIPVSADDLEGVLEFQIGRMQKCGVRVSPEILDQLRKILKESQVIPTLSHYLSFLDAWKAGDYPTSFGFLYRYFDYTTQIRDRHFYQYALMNLAILHSDFGCHKEAIDAMLEAISIARENRDLTCLNFALNWLFHFGRSHPRLVKEMESTKMLGRGKESLSYLRMRAKETGMWMLSSSSLLSEAKMGLSSGDSINASLENILRSNQVIVERNTKVMMGAQLSMSMVFWDRLGLTRLSLVVCEVYLRCHARYCVFEDKMKVTCRLAGHLAGRGRYTEAFERLESMGSNLSRVWKPHQYCKKYRGLLKLRRDLHRENLGAAENLLAQLLQERVDDLEPDLAFIVDTLHVEALIRLGDLVTAEGKVDAMLSELREENKDVALRIRLLLLKVQIFDLAGRPQKGFALVLRAASLAWRARLLRLLWQAIGALANILNSLQEFTAAADLLTAILPRCLECEAVFLSGTLYSTLADARMGQARQASQKQSLGTGNCAKVPTKTELLNKAHEALDFAFDQFSAVEDVGKQTEVVAKKAVIMRALGDNAPMNEFSAKYLVLRRQRDGSEG